MSEIFNLLLQLHVFTPKHFSFTDDLYLKIYQTVQLQYKEQLIIYLFDICQIYTQDEQEDFEKFLVGSLRYIYEY